MKLNRNNILLGVLLILLLIISLCILSKNTIIETAVSYGLDDCIPQNPKIVNVDTYNSIGSTLENCIREFKAYSADSSICNGVNIIANNNQDICSGGEYGLGTHE